MRCIFFAMALVGWIVGNPAQAQPNTLTKEEITEGWILGFDGTSTMGWIIQGDAKVVDGVLVLGGARPTRVQAMPVLGRTFRLRLEYRTEGKLSVIAWETRGPFFSGSHSSSSLDRQSKDPAEWIEVIHTGEFDPDTGMRSRKSQTRALGEAAFVARDGGATTASGDMRLSFEIPAGAKLHIRNVKLQMEPTESMPWYLWVFVTALVGVAVVAIGAMIVWIRRRAGAPRPRDLLPRQRH